MGVLQVLPGKTATVLFSLPFQCFHEKGEAHIVYLAYPIVLAYRLSTFMKIGQQNRLVGQIEHILFFTQQYQFQTKKTSHRTFDGEILRMTTVSMNRDII